VAASKQNISRAKQARLNRIVQDLKRLRAMRAVGGSGRTEAQDGSAPDGKTRGISSYRIVRLIGEGATSRVYLAKKDNDTMHVLKMMETRMSRNDIPVKRFAREAKLISELHNRFVVRIYGRGFMDDYGYIAMEYFPRGDLKQRIRLGVEPYLALRYMSDLANGLAAIHSVGVVHRDLKPANLMFRRDDTLVLADFGISKRIDDKADEELTMIGQVLGTPYYMSPEQAQGQKVDVRADLYSAGIILYELLAGEKPYKGRTSSGIIYQHIHADLPRLPDKLHRFQFLINRLLAKEPDHRFGSAGELLTGLRQASGLSNLKKS